MPNLMKPWTVIVTMCMQIVILNIKGDYLREIALSVIQMKNLYAKMDGTFQTFVFLVGKLKKTIENTPVIVCTSKSERVYNIRYNSSHG